MQRLVWSVLTQHINKKKKFQRKPHTLIKTLHLTKSDTNSSVFFFVFNVMYDFKLLAILIAWSEAPRSLVLNECGVKIMNSWLRWSWDNWQGGKLYRTSHKSLIIYFGFQIQFSLLSCKFSPPSLCQIVLFSRSLSKCSSLSLTSQLLSLLFIDFSFHSVSLLHFSSLSLSVRLFFSLSDSLCYTFLLLLFFLSFSSP